MIVYGQDGKGKGKLGSSVYSINHGVQIKREYNGTISNPNTPAQVSQRSRFKLASQVSASLAPVIAIPRKGIQSPRNLFVKKNMGYFYSDAQGAFVSYENLQITPGCVGLPGIEITRFDENSMNIALLESVLGAFDTVVYNVFRKIDEENLLLIHSEVCEVDADNGSASIETDNFAGNLVVYAYGIRQKNAKARAIYGNCQINSGTDVAELVANRTLEMNNFQFSVTRGSSIGANEQENAQPSANGTLLYITATNGSTVKVKINQENEIIIQNDVVPVPIGATVKLTCEPAAGFQFAGWKNNGEQIPFAQMNPYTFTQNEIRDIICSTTWATGLE